MSGQITNYFRDQLDKNASVSADALSLLSFNASEAILGLGEEMVGTGVLSTINKLSESAVAAIELCDQTTSSEKSRFIQLFL